MKTLTTTFALIFTLFTTVAFGQSEFKVLGNAANVSTKAKPNSFQLTSTGKGEKGGVWHANKLDIRNNSFVLTFDAHFGKKNSKGSDGIGLVFQADARGVKALGSGNNSKLMGFDAIEPSLAIEFDTYDDGAAAGDIAADHIALIKNGSDNLADQLTTPVPALESRASIEDNKDHRVQIEWNAPTKTLAVYFDGALRKTYSGDIVSDIFKNQDQIFWGFTSSSSKNGNKHQVSRVALQLGTPEGTINPLPVELLQFNSTATATGNVLNWATATEKNSSYFEVERSTDARTWTVVDRVNAKGNSSLRIDYSFTDNAAQGLTYYRLKMVDLDGTTEYSRVITVKGTSLPVALTVYPNPVQASETLNIRFTAGAELTRIQISDLAGNLVYSEQATTPAGANTLQISTASLKPGMYVLQLQNGGLAETTRLVVR